MIGGASLLCVALIKSDAGFAACREHATITTDGTAAAGVRAVCQQDSQQQHGSAIHHSILQSLSDAAKQSSVTGSTRQQRHAHQRTPSPMQTVWQLAAIICHSHELDEGFSLIQPCLPLCARPQATHLDAKQAPRQLTAAPHHTPSSATLQQTTNELNLQLHS